MACILVVDDRPANREYLVTLLTYAGHRMIEADDGREALVRVRAERPDLVITDILMPTMDGYEFVQHLRADPDVGGTPVIFYTATYSAPEARRLADAAGVEVVLPKPSEPEEVLKAVHSQLKLEVPVLRASAPRAAFDATEPLRQLRQAGAPESFGERLILVLQMNLELAATHHAEKMLAIAFDTALQVVPAAYVAMGVEEVREPRRRHALGKGVDVRGYLRGEPLAGAVALAVANRRIERAQPAPAGCLPQGHPPAGAVLAVPLSTRDQAYGWLSFARADPAAIFTDEEQQMAAILAAVAAMHFEKAQVYRMVEQHAARLQLESAQRRNAELDLRASELRFRNLVEQAADGILLLSQQAECVDLNRRALDMLGYAREELVGASIAMVVEAHQRRQVPTQMANVLSGRDYQSEWRLVRKNGTEFFGEISAKLLSDGHVLIIVRDATERRAQEQRILRLNRVYAMLSGINASIVRERRRQGLFEQACRIAVESGGFRMVWIGALGEDGIVEPLAAAGGVENNLERIRNIMRTFPDEPTAWTIRSGTTFVCNDVAGDPSIPWRDAAVLRGYLAVAVLPLHEGGKVVGVLELCAGETGFFDSQEMKLLAELAGNISYAMEFIARDERLEFLASYDPVTRLPNRRLFLEQLGQEIGRAAGSGRRLALAMLDLDHFKAVNDSLGRHGGDELLKAVADRLGASNASARLGRAEGDTFCILLADVEQAEDVIRALRQAVLEPLSTPFRVAGQDVVVTGRLGVAIYPADGDDAEGLLRKAEAALKKAKDTAARQVFYTRGMGEAVVERVTLENRLHRALERNEFALHYQPKVDLRSGAIDGAEALIRWNSPDLGLMPPQRFVPVLEESGLILEVGLWAFRQARIDRQRWIDAGLKAPPVAVNVSPQQLRQADFVEQVSRVLEPAGHDTGLAIEVTESMLMHDIELTIAKLQAFRAKGMGIAIDDFGTGYSSLMYLHRLPITEVKVDRSFIVKMTDNADTMAIVSTILSLAHSMKLKVVAEGVDTPEQLKFLRLLRCDQLQGFIFSEPLPADAFGQLLREDRRLPG